MTEVNMPRARDKSLDYQILRECAIRPISKRATTTVDANFWTELRSGTLSARFDFLREQLKTVLTPEASVDSIEKTDLLQSIARYSLRMGAWTLLKQVISALLVQVRHEFSTQHRLSIATGLISEWALAAGDGQCASIYASESLAWGSETHRIRAYLAYASSLMGPPKSSRDRLNFELSRAATEQQALIQDRHQFTLLHHFRLVLLRKMDRLENAKIESLTISDCAEVGPVFDQCKKSSNSVVSELAVFAYWVGNWNQDTVLSGPADEVACFHGNGRWRELQLIETMQGNNVEYLLEEERQWITMLDSLSEKLVWPQCPIVDKYYLDRLPTKIETATVYVAKRRLLCCI